MLRKNEIKKKKEICSKIVASLYMLVNVEAGLVASVFVV